MDLIMKKPFKYLVLIKIKKTISFELNYSINQEFSTIKWILDM
jgi:hypothetical protein